MAYSLETQCIHGSRGADKNHSFGAVAVPIYQTATFAHPGVGRSTGYDYTRVGNPTRDELEHVMTVLEHGVDCVACSTGMAAVGIMLELFGSGDHFVCSEDLYGGSVRMFNSMGTKRGMTYSYVNTADPAAVEAAVNEHTKALYIETPSNPTMEITDLRRMKEIAKAHGLLLIVDNTFMTPYLMTPIDLGADLVLHSGTKYLGGHNDTLAGFVVSADRELAEKVRYAYMNIGPNLAPFDSFLVLRGIKTLAVRMEAQQKSAEKIANWLKEQDKITEVLYVGLEDHPGHAVHLSQARGGGAMISFHVDSKETAIHLLENLHLISYAESLGGVESLMTFPMLQTHAAVPEEVRNRLGITDTLLRFSVGLEQADDIIEDLKQALEG